MFLFLLPLVSLALDVVFFDDVYRQNTSFVTYDGGSRSGSSDSLSSSQSHSGNASTMLIWTEYSGSMLHYDDWGNRSMKHLVSFSFWIKSPSCVVCEMFFRMGYKDGMGDQRVILPFLVTQQWSFVRLELPQSADLFNAFVITDDNGNCMPSCTTFVDDIVLTTNDCWNNYSGCPDTAMCVNGSCVCRPGFQFVNGSCLNINECLSFPCSPLQTCIDSYPSRTLQEVCFDVNDTLPVITNQVSQLAFWRLYYDSVSLFIDPKREFDLSMAFFALRGTVKMNATECAASSCSFAIEVYDRDQVMQKQSYAGSAAGVNFTLARTMNLTFMSKVIVYGQAYNSISIQDLAFVISACAKNNGGCAKIASCRVNNLNVPQCTCPTGYSGNGVVCTDVDECMNNSNQCGNGRECRNIIGSYVCSPIIAANFPKLVTGNSSAVRLQTFRTTAGGEVVQLQATFSSQLPDDVKVYYGPSLNTSAFECAIQQTTRVADACVNCTTIMYLCSSSAGMGTGLQMVLAAHWGSVRLQVSANISFSYPPPSITPQTLKAIGDPTGSNTLRGAPLAMVSFNGTNFFQDMHVFVGPIIASPSQFECTIIKAQADYVVCQLPISIRGPALFFWVIAGSQQAKGTDMLQVAAIPAVFAVSGCSEQAGSGTSMCPTEGGRNLTLVGYSFLSPVTVLIDSAECPINYLDDSSLGNHTLQCVLPPGVGTGSIVVNAAGIFSAPSSLVTFAPPSISQLIGCTTQSSLQVMNCEREGNNSLQIIGSNFGERGAQVLIGTSQCTSVIHDAISPHTLLTCEVPPGTDVNSVVVVAAGSLSNSTATLSYRACVAGTYAVGLNCVNCSAGNFSARGASSCSPCRSGSFSNASMTSACVDCEVGKFQVSVGSTSCQKCLPGTYANNPGSATCTSCPAQSFSSESGATACSFCPGGMSTSAAGDRCVCAAAMAWKETRYEVCPTGAECTKEGQLFGKLNALKGYWSQDAIHFYRCESGAICPGGFFRCGELRTGVLCSQCVTGTSAGGMDNVCSFCETSEASIAGFIGLLIVICAALVVVYYLAVKNMTEATSSTEESSLNDPKSVSRVPSKIISHSSTMRSSLNSSDDGAVDGSEKQKPWENSLETKIKLARPRANLKILLAFIQVLTTLSAIRTLSLPSYFAVFVNVFRFVNLDLLPWNYLSCSVGPIDFFVRTMFKGFIPVFVLMVFSLFFLLPALIYQRFHRYQDSQVSAQNTQRSMERGWLFLFFTLFLVFPSTSRSVLAFFTCQDIDGTTYLAAEPALGCGSTSEQWTSYLPLFVVFVIVYPIGVPSVMSFFLFRSRSETSPLGKAVSKFLSPLVPRRRWFEMADWTFRLALTGVLPIFASRFLPEIGATFTLVQIVVVLLSCPYKSTLDDRLQLLSLVEIALVCLAVSTMAADPSSFDTFWDPVMSAVLIGLSAVVGWFGLLYSARRLKSVLFRMVRRRTSKKETAPQVSSSIQSKLDINLDGGS